MPETISHGWVTTQPDNAAKDVSERNLNNHEITYADLTPGTVLRASGATAAAFTSIQDADLPGSIARTADLPVGDRTYTHVQSVAATTWVVVHGLSKHPSVSVVDSAGTLVIGSVQYLDLNQVRLDFSTPFSGNAYCN